MRHLILFLVLFVSQLALATNLKMAVIGDAGLAGQDFDNLRFSIADEKTKSLILPGDNLYFGRYNWTWDNWKKLGFTFDVVAIGNHNDGYEKEIRYFNMPGEFYSVVKSGARFLVLNSDNVNNVDQQMQWLRDELTRASEKLIFLIYHHPSFTVSDDHHWRDKEKFQLQMHQIFRDFEGKISALLLGHDHISTFVNFGPIPAVIAGAGREVLKSNPVSYEDDGFKVKTLFLAPRTQHWAQLEISERADEAWVHFVRVSDQHVACSAHLKDGGIKLKKNCD